MRYEFPKEFVWGVATAAQQIEGAAEEDGRGLSIWDVFADIPGKINHGDKPDVACDFYHRYEQDILLMKEMGIQSFRFSFSWSRIIPNGDGEVNPKGIEFYKKLIACLKENGITANATMYHWDLPYALQLKGGFGNRDIIKWFTNYANILLDNFGNDVDFWVTFNEPIAVYVGNAIGFFAPGLKDEKYARQCLHHLLVCHGEVVKLFRTKKLMNSKIGIVVDVWKHYPGRPGNSEDEASVILNNECTGFGMFLNPVFLGEYSKEHMSYMEKNHMVPKMEAGDFETIHQKLDFYGLNFYNGLIDHVEEMQKRELERKKAGGNYQNRPDNHTEKLYDVLHMLVEKYHVDIPIYITENGLPITDSEDMELMLHDTERIEYVKSVLVPLHKAIQDGIDIRGYYLWSLMDNFEWSAGYEARFGICYTDFKTQQRIQKDSAKWYTKVITENGLEV